MFTNVRESIGKKLSEKTEENIDRGTKVINLTKLF